MPDDREIVVSRLIDGPPRLVFEAYSEVRHLSRWFGPDGFSTTTQSFDFRPGGTWVFTMHGPDGTEYPNHVEYREIFPHDRIVMLHGSRESDPKAFTSTITFTERDGGCEVTLLSVFNTKEQRDEVVERYHAIEGAEQTLARLGAHIENRKKGI
jgi:uncharacterized protein YndB with AHSA1/START domain